MKRNPLEKSLDRLGKKPKRKSSLYIKKKLEGKIKYNPGRRV